MFMVGSEVGDSDQARRLSPNGETVLVIAKADLFSECMVEALAKKFPNFDVVSVSSAQSISEKDIHDMRLVLFYHVFVNVTYPAFLLHSLPLSLVLTVFAIFWRASGTFRPYDAKLFGWEGVVFILLRWPWSLAGSLAAVRDHITGSFVDFRITPKGDQGLRKLPARIIAPYIALAGICAAAMISSFV